MQDTRSLTRGPPEPRVRINRWTGVRAIKKAPPKTDWQVSAEKQFLAERVDVNKDALLHWLTEDDVRHLSPEMRRCLTLRCANSEELSQWRKTQWMRKFQLKPFDTNSAAVVIAMLTEKIMRMRAHLLRNPLRFGHQMVKISMSIKLAKRNRMMKALYKRDYPLYKTVCDELGLRCVRYAIPGDTDPSKMVNTQAVDGDRARFLIRQRLYRAKWRPREMRDPHTNQLIRYTRHPLEPPPESHGKARAAPQQISRAWPYSLKQDRVQGKQVVYNPTAPGLGYLPQKLNPIGGPVEE